MDALAVTCIVVGILIIVMRAPLIFAPRATLRAYDRVIFSTNARCRAFSVSDRDSGDDTIPPAL